MQSFRASPWVSYEPSLRTQQDLDQASGSEMDEDPDMEAPHISTLREDESPPPHKKAAVNSKKRPRPNPTSGEPWKRVVAAREADDVDDEEDQLDQLIDDDGNGNTMKASPSSRPTDAAQKRKASAKRKPRKGEKKAGETEKKTKDKIDTTSGQLIAPTISFFEANPADSYEDMNMNSSTTPMVQVQVADSSSGKGKIKASPQKHPMSRATGKVTM